MHSWLTSRLLCPVDIILRQRELHVQIWFHDDRDDLVSHQHPPHGKDLVSLHNISCSRRMPLSHYEKYIHVRVYTVVGSDSCTVLSALLTPKVPKLATAHKQRGIYPSTNGSMTCSHSMCFQMAFKCIRNVQKALKDTS